MVCVTGLQLAFSSEFPIPDGVYDGLITILGRGQTVLQDVDFTLNVVQGVETVTFLDVVEQTNACEFLLSIPSFTTEGIQQAAVLRIICNDVVEYTVRIPEFNGEFQVWFPPCQTFQTQSSCSDRFFTQPIRRQSRGCSTCN